ncbi:MAG: nickel pincer cofactor biosynthesis protein LarC [Candidatus Hydrothermarchaeales archaeon]
MKVLLIDSRNAGISGDMFIAALLDLGADFNKIKKALASISDYLGEYKVGFEKTKKDGLASSTYHFKFEEKEIGFKKACEAINKAEISKKAKNFALNCRETLTSAEAHVHGIKKEDLKLHEASDSIADFVSAAVALDDLNLFDAHIIATHINTGKGFFVFHGKRQPVPGPAVVEILKGKPIFGDVDTELTTPTGATFMANMVDEYVDDLPHLKIEKTGYGAGKKDLEVPNVLRLAMGETVEHSLVSEKISILETNIDDVSGEILGYAVEKLLEEGAKDVSLTPVLMKKNRPGHIMTVICKKEDEEKLSKLIMEETGSLGVRVSPEAHRYVLKQEIVYKDVKISGQTYKVGFKVSKDKKGNITVVKPEFEDIKKIASNSGLSALKVKKILDGECADFY